MFWVVVKHPYNPAYANGPYDVERARSAQVATLAELASRGFTDSQAVTVETFSAAAAIKESKLDA